MKKIILLSLAIFAFTASFAQQTFETAMKTNLDSLTNAKNPVSVQDCVNRFERMANAEPNRWEAFYHLAYSQIIYNFWLHGNNKRQTALLDQADTNLEKALGLKGDKSEIYTLQGFIFQSRIQLEPAQAMQYAQQSSELFNRAIQANKDNPRPYYLSGMNTFYTPEQFGGGVKNALPKFETAKEKFDVEKKANKNVLLPVWGADENEKMIEKCKK